MKKIQSLNQLFNNPQYTQNTSTHSNTPCVLVSALTSIGAHTLVHIEGKGRYLNSGKLIKFR